MKRGLVFGVMLVSVIILSISFVSAVWWNPFDWFEEPRLSGSPCTETDGGKEYGVKGTTTGWYEDSWGNEVFGPKMDQCGRGPGGDYYSPWGYRLTEYYCGVGDRIESEIINCEFDCNFGACLNSQCEIDSDCDDNKDYTIDTCDNYGQCEYNPSSPVCTDSDGGIVLNVRGFIQEKGINILSGNEWQRNNTDSCIESNLLEEYDCGEEMPVFNPNNYYCPNGCIDGACQGNTLITCNSESKCISERELVTLENNCKVIDKSSCKYGCANDACRSAWGIEIIRYDIFPSKLVIEDDLFTINLTIKNNVNRNLQDLPITIDDNNGWNLTKEFDLNINEVKDISFNFISSSSHMRYNPHQFKISSGFSDDSGISTFHFNPRIIVFDRDTITTMEEGETKNIIIDGKEYEVFLAFVTRSTQRFDIRDDLTTPDFPEDQASVLIISTNIPDYAGGPKEVTFALAPPGITPTCEDSDLGKEYEEKGETCFGVDCREDVCDGLELTEYYCVGDNIRSEVYDCMGLCEDGECPSDVCWPSCGSTEDVFDCVDDNTRLVCELSNGCHYLEEVNCASDETCEEGFCIPAIIPNPNACETTGLRQANKYCSQEKLWITQKSTNRVCDNDFECRSNICTNDKCQSKTPEPNTLIYWIIGGALILLLIAIIVIIIVLNSKK